MPAQTIHIHRDAPAKPPEGEPCNGCGVCCLLETCPLARLRFLQAKGPCPALAWSASEKRYLCGLLVNPEKYIGWRPATGNKIARRLLSRWISAGQGCDCNADVQS